MAFGIPFYLVENDGDADRIAIAFKEAEQIRGPVVVLVLEAADAIKKWRDTMGATNPANAAEGTIRKIFANTWIGSKIS